MPKENITLLSGHIWEILEEQKLSLKSESEGGMLSHPSSVPPALSQSPHSAPCSPLTSHSLLVV